MGQAGLTDRKNSIISVGVRFCGSCNPYYDPAWAKAELERLLGFSLPRCGAELPELCVVFKQCNSGCFSHPEELSQYGTYIIQRTADIRPTAERLLRAIEELEEKRYDEQSAIH